MPTLRSHQSDTGNIGNSIGRCPKHVATRPYDQKNFPISNHKIIKLGNRNTINLMTRELTLSHTSRFCYRQATGHTHTPHNQIEGSWCSTLQTWCALNSAISITKDTATYPVKQTNGYVAEIRNPPHSSPLHLCLAALSASLKSTASLSHSHNDWEIDNLSSLLFYRKWPLASPLTPNSRSQRI
jgi:hypothetical protein